MQKIKCELCGSNDLKKIDGEYVCQYCGAKYSLEEARKLMVEISGTVKIDNSDKIANYETLATRALDDKDYKKADEYYGKLLEFDSQNWKYIYYKGLCEAQLGDYSAIIKGCERSFDVIKEKGINIKDIEKVKFQMANDIFEIETKNRDAQIRKFDNIIMSKEYIGIMSYRNGLIECVEGLEYAGRLIEELIERNTDIKQSYISITQTLIFCIKEIIKDRKYLKKVSMTGSRSYGILSVDPSEKMKYNNMLEKYCTKLKDLGHDYSINNKKNNSSSFFKTVLLVFFGVLLLAGLTALGELAGK